MEPVLNIRTPYGVVPVWGRLGTSDRLLFVIRGVNPTQDYMLGLVEALPEVDVALVHLPGMHTPFFRDHSVTDFAAAFDHVLAELGHSRVTAFGASTGGLVALAMKTPAIVNVVLMDTPLSTEPLWPLFSIARATRHPQAVEWFASVFGIFPDRVENRDYRPLLSKVTVPVTALVGEERLGEPRAAGRFPGLVSDEDRDLYARHPLVEVVTVAGAGHNISGHSPRLVVETLRRHVASPSPPAP